MTGVCYLGAHDRAGARRAFAELARIAAKDPTPRHRTWAIELGLHDVNLLDLAARARVIAFGDALAAPGSKADVYAVLAHALASTRAGRLKEAEVYIDLTRNVRQGDVPARADAELAIIRRLQGRVAEAHKLADAAAADLPRHKIGALTNEWIGAIFLRLLVDEARRPSPKTAR